MASIDIFNGDAFSMVELTTAINRQPYTPHWLGSLPMWSTKPIRTKAAAIEEYNGTLSLIPSDERGSPPNRVTKDKRKVYYVQPPRLSQADTIYADEIQNIRAYGSETELKQVATELQMRNQKMRNQMLLTMEYHKLGAVQGVVYDSNGSTEIVNWFTTFGITQDDEIDFDLDNASPASGAVRKLCTQVVRQTLRGLGMPMVGPNMAIYGLCGDTFWDQLTAHSEVRTTYLNQSEASELRTGNAFGMLNYGGVTFVNYRGADDGAGTEDSTVTIPDTKCKFFPAVQDMFERIFAPGEWFDVINMPGQEFYNLIVRDNDRNAWVQPELYSYPLHVCTRPKALQRARNT